MLTNTLAGTYTPLGSDEIKGMRLPAFDKSRIITNMVSWYLTNNAVNDIILGKDFLQKRNEALL